VTLAKILYQSSAGLGDEKISPARIYADGSSARPLTNDSLVSWSGSWSSDGAFVAYARAASSVFLSAPVRLVVLNDDGSSVAISR
jgi:hypothetical protein